MKRIINIFCLLVMLFACKDSSNDQLIITIDQNTYQWKGELIEWKPLVEKLKNMSENHDTTTIWVDLLPGYSHDLSFDLKMKMNELDLKKRKQIPR